MCVNYIHYFPRTKSLEICKSSVDGNALKEYFDYLKRYVAISITLFKRELSLLSRAPSRE